MFFFFYPAGCVDNNVKDVNGIDRFNSLCPIFTPTVSTPSVSIYSSFL